MVDAATVDARLLAALDTALPGAKSKTAKQLQIELQRASDEYMAERLIAHVLREKDNIEKKSLAQLEEELMVVAAQEQATLIADIALANIQAHPSVTSQEVLRELIYDTKGVTSAGVNIILTAVSGLSATDKMDTHICAQNFMKAEALQVNKELVLSQALEKKLVDGTILEQGVLLADLAMHKINSSPAKTAANSLEEILGSKEAFDKFAFEALEEAIVSGNQQEQAR